MILSGDAANHGSVVLICIPVLLTWYIGLTYFVFELAMYHCLATSSCDHSGMLSARELITSHFFNEFRCRLISYTVLCDDLNDIM